MWRVIGDLILLAVAVWAFAAIFEPLQSWTFGQSLSPGLIVCGRVLAAVLEVGCLALLIFNFVWKQNSGRESIPDNNRRRTNGCS
jgi:hypothetical protein